MHEGLLVSVPAFDATAHQMPFRMLGLHVGICAFQRRPLMLRLICQALPNISGLEFGTLSIL